MGSTRKTSIDIFNHRVEDGELVLYPSDQETGGRGSGCSRVEDPSILRGNIHHGRQGLLSSTTRDRLGF